YFPKKDLLTILSRIKNLWENQQDRIITQANDINKILNANATLIKSPINKDISVQALDSILSEFDELEGGFGNAPKFPNESILLLLINEQFRHPNAEQLEAITLTLDTMASGGIYDTIGGGFHRYAIDSAWLIPHFEKMLYNQAQLALVYARAYKLTQKPLYKKIAEQTLDYVLKEMQGKNGGFFSATDADSQGEEGRFFIWSKDELENSLSKNEFTNFNKWFDLSHSSEIDGAHVIHFKNINSIKTNEHIQINKILDKLYQVRIKRIPPLTDKKILLSWNALMIPALLEAGEIFNDSKYTESGLDLANYLYDNFYKDGELYRVSIDNKLEAKALFEDYAYLANAYISAFDQTNNNIWLERTIQLIDTMNDKFWDKKEFGFNIAHNSKYINNNKESYDAAIPSSNGIAYQVLVKLNNRISNKDLEQQKHQLLSAFANNINQDPYGHSSFILGINNDYHGEVANTQYVYDGRIHIQSTKLSSDQFEINIKLKPIWHINSNKPLQDSLIATNIVSANKNWEIIQASYPKGNLVKLGFSSTKLSIYKNQVSIKVKLNNKSEDFTPPILTLTLQACSDEVCLPPTDVDLLI
ncbi:MAG: protein-disulfide reductase DsbD family protein, partial [Candidatus Thioglobus sp.]|uniref:protein-disulfide reductase DsbD domain-containing protein n=1 Tax=Candidatus Thioglobus sp. TaxID=2026721 RepID=UPI00263117FF